VDNISEFMIKTQIDPKKFEAEYKTILVFYRYGGNEFPTTAGTEYFNNSYDAETGIFTYSVSLTYPRHSADVDEVRKAMGVTRDGHIYGVAPDYLLTQKDFDAVIKKEKIEVPVH
jgi:hypothetical protein